MTRTVVTTKLRLSRALLVLAIVGLSCAADTMTADPYCVDDTRRGSRGAAVGQTGRLIVLPGVGNTEFHLAGFIARASQQLPGFDVGVRTWGIPFLTLHNLRAHERNIETAREIADEIARWRRAHPDELLYVVGYSGGGGIATLVVSALPEGIAVDRLLLVAPAISPDYPIEERVLPHVNEFVANYASELDLQVGLGTRTFGTIDRVKSDSAGAVGFDAAHPDLLQRHWSQRDRIYGHRGNHMAYLGRRWQSAVLLPAMDPRLSAEQVLARWAPTCEER